MWSYWLSFFHYWLRCHFRVWPLQRPPPMSIYFHRISVLNQTQIALSGVSFVVTPRTGPFDPCLDGLISLSHWDIDLLAIVYLLHGLTCLSIHIARSAFSSPSSSSSAWSIWYYELIKLMMMTIVWHSWFMTAIISLIIIISIILCCSCQFVLFCCLSVNVRARQWEWEPVCVTNMSQLALAPNETVDLDRLM